MKENIAPRLNKVFDKRTMRHRIGNDTMVVHCHHYTTLYTQLALDCSLLDAKTLLAECAEDAWGPFLTDYYQTSGITALAERIDCGERIYAAAGMGKMRVICAGPESGEVILERSHLDEGWRKKWGQSEQPVNFITAGFIAGLFSAVFTQPLRHYLVIEDQSIATGEEQSHFTVVTR